MKYVALSLLVSSIASAQPAPDPEPTPPPPTPEPTPAPEPSPEAPPPAPAPAENVYSIGVPPDSKGDTTAALEPKSSGYKDGFILQATDGSSKLLIGGISQFDGRFFIGDDANALPDQFAFRTLRLDLRGTVYDHFDFRFMPDFAGSKLVVQDAYVDIRYSNVIKVRFGKFKVPFGLERLQNETSTTFAERGLPTQLAPNRDLGVQAFGELADGTLAYQLGIFNGVADGGSSDGDATDDKEGAARVFIRPFATGPKIVKNLGVGAAVTFGDKAANLTQADTPVWKTAGQTTIFQYKAGTTLADTVVADGRHLRATGQGYYFAGQVGVLAEYVRSVQHVVLNGTHDNVTADSWQAVLQYVLTDDEATYNSVTPRHPFDPKTGEVGAFDVTARVGELRQTDGTVFALFADPTKSVRRAWSGGVGVDWFANRAFRGVLDLERTWFSLGAKTGATASDRAAETSIIARVQLVF
jgi:phosphate-selective porin OprO and OprP